jgi:hypothetical protein
MEKKENKKQDVIQEDVVAKNLAIFEQARLVPESAIKPIVNGRLKGKSDINPMFRIKRMTEMFGPCGFGWKYEIVNQWIESHGNEVKCFTQINLYIKMGGEWSDAIPGIGGAAFVSMESKGPYVNDECYKMSLTDAMSVAMKALGVAADIYYSKDGNNLNPGYSKYRDGTMQAASADMAKAVDEMKACKSRDEIQAVWSKWSTKHPEFCQQGTDFYKAAAQVGQDIQNKNNEK